MHMPRVGDEAQFRFLTDAEFRELDVTQKAAYLARASQELERRQRALRAHARSMQLASCWESAA